MPFVTLDRRGEEPPLVLNHEIWEGGGSRDGTVLLVHELGGSLQSFAEFGRELARTHRVIAFDQRGAGLSEKPTRPWTLLDLANDVDRLAEALQVRGRIHLVGLAMGAVTALHAAVHHAARLASLVLFDCTSEITEAARSYILERAGRVRRAGMRPVLEQSFGNAFRGLPGAAGRWEAYRQAFLANPPESYAHHSEALAAMSLAKGELVRASCPTLVLTGEHDFIWPPAVGKKLASLLPQATFEVVPAAAHFPPVQDPRGTSERVARFLSGLRLSRAGPGGEAHGG